MRQISSQESETIAEIERLELEARNLRQRVEHLQNDEDRRVVNRQLKELGEQIDFLRLQLR